MSKLRKVLTVVLVFCIILGTFVTAGAFEGETGNGVYQLEMTISGAGKASKVGYASYISRDTELMPQLYGIFDVDYLTELYKGSNLGIVVNDGIEDFETADAETWRSYVEDVIGAQCETEGVVEVMRDKYSTIGQLADLGKSFLITSANFPEYTIFITLRDQAVTTNDELEDGTFVVTEEYPDETIETEYNTDGEVVDTVTTDASTVIIDRQPDGHVVLDIHIDPDHDYHFEYDLSCDDAEACPSAVLGFEDNPLDAWYHDYIDFCVDNGLTNGTTDTTYEPEISTTRAMMITLIYRIEKSPAVEGKQVAEDVPTDEWYSDAVEWGYENGIINGMTETEYCPDENVTREQLALILYRYAKYVGVSDTKAEGDLTKFSDAGDVADWSADAVRWAARKGIIEGTDGGRIAPQDDALRSEIAAMLMRFCLKALR